MPSYLMHEISYEKRRDIRIRTTSFEAHEPVNCDGHTTFLHAELMASHEDTAKGLREMRTTAIGALLVSEEACTPEPSLGQLVREQRIPSGATIFRALIEPEQINIGSF